MWALSICVSGQLLAFGNVNPGNVWNMPELLVNYDTMSACILYKLKCCHRFVRWLSNQEVPLGYNPIVIALSVIAVHNCMNNPIRKTQNRTTASNLTLAGIQHCSKYIFMQFYECIGWDNEITIRINSFLYYTSGLNVTIILTDNIYRAWYNFYCCHNATIDRDTDFISPKLSVWL